MKSTMSKLVSDQELLKECDIDTDNCKGLLFKNCGYNPKSYPQSQKKLEQYISRQLGDEQADV